MKTTASLAAAIAAAIALASHNPAQANATTGPMHADQIAPAGYCMYSNPVPPPGGICTQLGAVVGRFMYSNQLPSNNLFPSYTARP
jgi:hypothetical protein